MVFLTMMIDQDGFTPQDYRYSKAMVWSILKSIVIFGVSVLIMVKLIGV